MDERTILSGNPGKLCIMKGFQAIYISLTVSQSFLSEIRIIHSTLSESDEEEGRSTQQGFLRRLRIIFFFGAPITSPKIDVTASCNELFRDGAYASYMSTILIMYRLGRALRK
jgi:hypothetical protein